MIEILKRYRDAKAQCPDGAILFFKTGSTYEAYCDDAEVIGPLLGVPVVKQQDYSFAYFPAHHLEAYIRGLIDKGHRVAICEQIK